MLLVPARRAATVSPWGTTNHTACYPVRRSPVIVANVSEGWNRYSYVGNSPRTFVCRSGVNPIRAKIAV